MTTDYPLVALTIILVTCAIHKIIELEVDPEDFSFDHRIRIDAEAAPFFQFLTQDHVLEKLLPWLTRLKENDARILSPGKVYRAYLELPVFRSEKILLAVVEYQASNLLILETRDTMTRQRIEIRTQAHRDRTILHTRFYLRKTSAVYHYTVGLVIRNYVARNLEKSSAVVAAIYRAVEKRRRVTEYV